MATGQYLCAIIIALNAFENDGLSNRYNKGNSSDKRAHALQGRAGDLKRPIKILAQSLFPSEWRNVCAIDCQIGRRVRALYVLL